MIYYKTEKPRNSKLSPYIEEYVSLNIYDTSLSSKDLIPKPGALWSFTSMPLQMNEKILPTDFLMGIQTQHLYLKWNGQGYGFFVKFLPYGLSRFLDIPVYQLTNQIVGSQELWGDSIRTLSNQILDSSSLDEQVELTENYLLNKFIEPSKTEKKIFVIADKIKNDNTSPRYNELKDSVPLSSRQLERKFKELIGVNMQTFNRICMFDRSMDKMTAQYQISLTYLGYESGYYDQPHYSKEFKRLTRYSPKDFFKNSKFYRSIFKSR